jgi:hypothetical protein
VPIFTLWRSFDPNLSAFDLEMINVRAIASASFEPRFYWQRSYGLEIPGVLEGFCVYEGPSRQELSRQQLLCQVPFEEVREVEELCGQSRGAGPDEPPLGLSLFLVERDFPSAVSAEDLRASNTGCDSTNTGVAWMRSFSDGHRASSKCVFAAASEAILREAVAGSDATIQRIEKVALNHPSLWAKTYDQMGIPRHWETE